MVETTAMDAPTGHTVATTDHNSYVSLLIPQRLAMSNKQHSTSSRPTISAETQPKLILVAYYIGGPGPLQQRRTIAQTRATHVRQYLIGQDIARPNLTHVTLKAIVDNRQPFFAHSVRVLDTLDTLMPGCGSRMDK